MAGKRELAGFELEVSRSFPAQIAAYVREQIAAGTWQPGERLPTARELAELWGVDAATVHRGLAKLSREGVVERKRRAGTFVCERQRVLETVGICVRADAMRPGSRPFFQAVTAALEERATASGLHVRFFIEPSNAAGLAGYMQELAQAIRQQQVQALVVPSSDPEHTARFFGLGVPAVSVSSAPDAAVDLDQGQFARLAVEALVAAGCRRLGLISAYNPGRRDLYDAFAAATAAEGIEVHPEWVTAAPAGSFPGHESDYHGFGYEQVHRIRTLSERPDGLIVTPDLVAAGAVLALAELGMDVPGDLRLVLQRNQGVPLLCPMPATILEVDTGEVAEELLRQARRLCEGKPIQRVLVQHRLIWEHENSR